MTRLTSVVVPGNYLRVRGEYAVKAPPTPVAMELPPRARRILPLLYSVACPGGTTSACAENTIFPPQAWSRPWNYLRVRGEYRWWANRDRPQLELPPRARRIQPKCRIWPVAHGTTSACAENTQARTGAC